MKRPTHVSETPAVRWLKARRIEFSEHIYDYVEHGGTAVSAEQLGVDEHVVVKTLVMEDEKAVPLVVLMHGDYTVSTRKLARQLGRKSIEACQPAVALRHSGYQIGGTSPFGTRKPLPICVERSVLALDRIYINGGRRGYLVGLDPRVLERELLATPVDCAQKAGA